MTRDPLFQSPKLTRLPPREKRRVGEVAGGAAAECAAVCCCCPCSVMNLLILAVYKVPKGLCMKAWVHTKKKRRCAVQKKGRLGGGGGGGDDDDDGKRASSFTEGDGEKNSNAETDGADLLEKEMWDRFHGAGFWRSASRRES